jgi:peptidoglycan/xylan/chitin deacetylase (PgdA/CDA1 family)
MQERLTLGPAWVQLVKPVLTRVRTVAWRARGARAKPGLRILFYHRVAEAGDPLAIAPRRFAEQMDELRAQGCRVLDVVAALDALHRGESADQQIVALSFDDGYSDVAANAAPILERHGFRATVFVCPAVVDGTAAYTWYHEQPPVLDWNEIVALDGSPLTFEAHTLTHPDLTALDAAAAEREIAGSKVQLEARLGRPVRAFCYPAGLYGARERALVERAGFELATTCEPGANTPATDPLALHRTAIDRHDSVADFRAKVAGGHDRPSLLRAGYRRARRARRARRTSTAAG